MNGRLSPFKVEQRKRLELTGESLADWIKGFAGWFAFWTVVWLAQRIEFKYSEGTGPGEAFALLFLIPVNCVTLIVVLSCLGMINSNSKSRYIALGVLSANILNLLVMLLLSLFNSRPGLVESVFFSTLPVYLLPFLRAALPIAPF